MSEAYVGEIRVFAGNFAPLGWALCDGALLPIADNQVLFTLIGTTYGGDGQNTFGLPDLRGRAVIHQGSGPGLSPYVIGEQVGQETISLVPAQMTSHSHSFGGTAAAGNTATPGPTAVLAGTPSGLPIYDGTANPIALSPQSVTSAGGSIPHNNRQPFLALTYIISLFGIFPSQN
jgi:microcystin-dependent protein